jgi:tRNA threonylcarbamoyl adenosine modification protein (Sua5/YciO/YrdC/YwlC family)
LAEILRVHPDEPQPDRIDYIVSCLRKGGVVALPTDTFYGLAVDPVNLYAVEQIYQIKTRQKHKPLSLLISGLAQAYELARDTDPLLDKLADRFWPGPLTIIVRAGTKLPLRSTANTGNVALRVPDAAIARAVVERFELPITATAGRIGVYPRGLRPRSDRRSHSTHHRWRPHGQGAAHNHCRSHAGRRTVGDFARGRDPDP